MVGLGAACACLLTVQVWLTIQRPGVFYGQCSELCGANHAFMPIVVEAVTPRQVRDTCGRCVSGKHQPVPCQAASEAV